MAKREGNKPWFRKVAKQEAYEYLSRMLQTKQRALKSNKSDIQVLIRQQRDLKADIAGLHQVIQEFKK